MSDDGSMARLPELVRFAKRHRLKICTIADLIEFRRTREKLIERIEVVKLPTDPHELLKIGRDLYVSNNLEESEKMAQRAKEAGVVNYIVKPLRESEVAPAIEVALARYNEFRAMEEKARTLSEQLETRKIVERAKGLLMEKQGLTEQEAFRKIQKASMNNRKSMREVAEAIILANEM